MSVLTHAGAALAVAAGLFAAACSADSPTDPLPPEAAFAKPDRCPPSCGGDDDGGGDPPTRAALLSGAYIEDPAGEAQPLNVGTQGRIFAITETSSGVGVAFLVPRFADAIAFGNTCIHSGFADDEEAMGFWNDVADDAVEGAQKFLARMDTKNAGANDTEHLHVIHWQDGRGYPEGNLTQFRLGNHDVYGAARADLADDVYSITDGGLKFSVVGGAGNHELVGVTCDNRPGGLGTSFVIELQ